MSHDLPPHDILDIHPKVGITLGGYGVVASLLAMILVLAAILVGVWWGRRRRPELTPLQVLRRELELFRPAPTVESYVRLSWLLRALLEAYTGLPATDRTRLELEPLLRRQLRLEPEQLEALIGFLVRAETIIYAGRPVDAMALDEDYRRVCRWVSVLEPQEAKS